MNILNKNQIADMNVEELTKYVNELMFNMSSQLEHAMNTLPMAQFNLIFTQDTYLRKPLSETKDNFYDAMIYNFSNDIREALSGQLIKPTLLHSSSVIYNLLQINGERSPTQFQFDQENVKRVKAIYDGTDDDVINDVLLKMTQSYKSGLFETSIRAKFCDELFSDFVNIVHALVKNENVNDVVESRRYARQSYNNLPRTLPYVSNFTSENMEGDFDDIGLNFKFVASSENFNLKLSKETIDILNKRIVALKI